MDRPRLISVAEADGHPETLVLVRGWLTRDRTSRKEEDRWAETLRASGWCGRIVHLWWDAGDDDSLAWRAVARADTGALGGLVSFGPIGLMAGAFEGAVAVWKTDVKNARRTGRRHVRALLEEHLEGPLTWVACSLGTRVVLEYLLEDPSPTVPSRDLVVLGGAVRRKGARRWRAALDALDGRILNFYNRDDDVLRYFKKARNGQQACGRRPIRLGDPRLVDVDVTGRVGGHSSFRKYLPSILAFDGDGRSSAVRVERPI